MLRDAAKAQWRYAIKRTRPHDYAVSDLIWLSGNNIRTSRPMQKLNHKYHGPSEVANWIRSQAYRLELGKTIGKIHNVFHVTLSEPYKPDGRVAPAGGAAAPPPPPPPHQKTKKKKTNPNKKNKKKHKKNKKNK